MARGCLASARAGSNLCSRRAPRAAAVPGGRGAGRAELLSPSRTELPSPSASPPSRFGGVWPRLATATFFCRHLFFLPFFLPLGQQAEASARRFGEDPAVLAPCRCGAGEPREVSALGLSVGQSGFGVGAGEKWAGKGREGGQPDCGLCGPRSLAPQRGPAAGTVARGRVPSALPAAGLSRAGEPRGSRLLARPRFPQPPPDSARLSAPPPSPVSLTSVPWSHPNSCVFVFLG